LTESQSFPYSGIISVDISTGIYDDLCTAGGTVGDEHKSGSIYVDDKSLFSALPEEVPAACVIWSVERSSSLRVISTTVVTAIASMAAMRMALFIHIGITWRDASGIGAATLRRRSSQRPSGSSTSKLDILSCMCFSHSSFIVVQIVIISDIALFSWQAWPLL
jgi:hypothetical protein